jgi:O-antigen ligase/polysaccharide polymerase Wzy-like membrane protein/tetratricopeptide repeat protein
MSAEAVRPSSVPMRRFRLQRAIPSLPALVAFAPVVGLAAAQGGYFPTSWGWASVPLLWGVAIALIVRTQARLNPYERVFVGALAAFTGWVALSAAWSSAFGQSILEAERVLVYVAAVSAALLLSRARLARQLLGGVLAAISLIAGFSLLTRLAPDRVGVYDPEGIYRLAQPIGYWNGLGLFAAMGALIAFGLAARARTIPARAACAALLVVLLPTLYFTFGRAAWIALAAGAVAALAVDSTRLQLLAALLVVGPAPAAAVLIASQQSGLTHAGTPIARAAHDGHRLAVVLALLAAVNAVLAVGFAYAERRVEVSVWVRRAFAVAVGVVLALTAAVGFNRYGGPVTLAKKGYATFKTAPPRTENDLNRRLLSFSGNGRAALWGLAWDDARRHPLLGAGPGTYERYFLAHQPEDVVLVRDAHGLYIETIAEVGPFGLALLIAAFLTPLAALKRARRHPLVPAAVGAYVAYLVHTGVDWDWELSAVTLAGLLCGVAILLFGRRWTPPRPLSLPTRVVGASAAVAAATFAAIALLGSSALSRSDSALEHGDPARAATDARRARSLMPWSPKPWAALARAQLAAGLAPDARRSFRRAISMDRGDWHLWYELAGASTGPAHRRALRRAVALFPRSGLLPDARVSRTRQR